jgi:hypothetical protein
MLFSQIEKKVILNLPRTSPRSIEVLSQIENKARSSCSVFDAGRRGLLTCLLLSVLSRSKGRRSATVLL